MEPPPSDEQDDEDTLIAEILSARPTPEGLPVSVDAGDDAAVVAHGTTVTVDALVEGVHFDARLSPADVGYKTLAVSVSDLAAMGARPSWCVLTLALPDEGGGPRRAWVQRFATGLSEACARWDVRLVGGDTVRTTGPRLVSLTLAGALVGAPMRRSGAALGDALWVTGTLGLAGAGWQLPDPPPEALAALRRPAPPLAFGLDLARLALATACMDLSDGLARDLPRLAAASGVRFDVDATLLPGHPVLGASLLRHQCTGGEDYQLLFTASPDHSASLHTLASQHGVRLTRIGTACEGDGAHLLGRAWPTGGFRHFSSSVSA